MKLYHVTTEKKAKKYRQTGHIKHPVRGFDTLMGAMFWAMKVGRKVVYEVEVGNRMFKLPDHHNNFGTAYFCDKNVYIKNIKCVVSPKKSIKKTHYD